MDEWHDFWVLTGTASATLTGLLFVALSVNKEAIAQQKHHRSVARQTMLCLCAVLVLAMLGLLPDQGLGAFGWEVALAALGNLVPSAVIQTRTLIAMRRSEPGHEASDEADWCEYLIKALIFNFTLLACGVAGVMLIEQKKEALFMLAPAVFAFSGLAVVNAWSLIMHVNDPAEDNNGDDENDDNNEGDDENADG